MRFAVPIFVAAMLCACGGETTGPKAPVAATITFATTPSSLVPNEEVTIQAVAKAVGGAIVANAPMTWTTSDPVVATVSTTGVVKALAAGTATITATSGTASATLGVSVDQGGFVGPAGGTITAFSGGVRLEVPAGALAAGTAIRLGPIATPPVDPTFVRGSGGSVQFNGTFAIPARLTLSYNPAERPTGLSEARLGLRVITANQWVPIAGSTADAAARTAGGAITSSGQYGVGLRPSDAPCTSAEHHQFDFRIGSFTWAGPNNLSGEADVTADAMGCTLREVLRIGSSETHAVFYYEPSNSQWHYTSLSGANITRLSGARDGDRMILYNAPRNTRVVWEQLSAAAHRQAGESSSNGTDWTRGGAGTYTRKGQ